MDPWRRFAQDDIGCGEKGSRFARFPTLSPTKGDNHPGEQNDPLAGDPGARMGHPGPMQTGLSPHASQNQA